MKPVKRDAKYASCLRRLERMTYERNMLLETVFFVRKMAQRVPDERAIFIEACDEVLKALAERQQREKKEKIEGRVFRRVIACAHEYKGTVFKSHKRTEC